MNLKEVWEAEADPWISFARSELADPVFWHFNLPAFIPLVPRPGLLTLDVGCGEGRVGRALQKLGHRVVGLDSAPSLVHAARTHAESLDVVVGDAAALPFGDASADLVVAFMVLHDVDDLTATCREAARVLRAGGRLCVAIGHPLQGIGDFAGPDRTGDYVITRSYFATTRLTYGAERGGKRVALNFTYRPLSAYTAELASAGFVLEELTEPVPPDEGAEHFDDVEQRRRIPSFVHLRARKE